MRRFNFHLLSISGDFLNKLGEKARCEFEAVREEEERFYLGALEEARAQGELPDIPLENLLLQVSSFFDGFILHLWQLSISRKITEDEKNKYFQLLRDGTRRLLGLGA